VRMEASVKGASSRFKEDGYSHYHHHVSLDKSGLLMEAAFSWKAVWRQVRDGRRDDAHSFRPGLDVAVLAHGYVYAGPDAQVAPGFAGHGQAVPVFGPHASQDLHLEAVLSPRLRQPTQHFLEELRVTFNLRQKRSDDTHPVGVVVVGEVAQESISTTVYQY
jgi:hypothetical protein